MKVQALSEALAAYRKQLQQANKERESLSNRMAQLNVMIEQLNGAVHALSELESEELKSNATNMPCGCEPPCKGHGEEAPKPEVA